MKRLIAVFILALPALAQQQGQLSLSGTVVNAKTGEPIRRALVVAVRFGATRDEIRQPGGVPVSIQPFRRTAFTDSAGIFHLTGLPAGQYSVTAQKPEFTFDFSGGPVGKPIDLSSSTEGFSVKLSPLGVITGTITDQDGIRLRSVNVFALSSQIQDGLRQVRSDRNVTTDDRGAYRFWGLPPGKYYVKVAGISGDSFQFVGDTAPTISGESFAPVYFGGTHELVAATPLEIGPGTEARADIPLKVEAGFGVSGSVLNFTPRHEIKFELLSGAEDVSATRAAINNETGRFSIPSVVSGSYILRATQGNSTAEAPVTVRSSGVDGVVMTLAAPVQIAVRTRFTNKPPEIRRAAIQSDDDDDLNGPDGNCSVILRPSVRSGVRPYLFSAPPENPGGDAVISEVPPGNYGVTILCFGAYARSATSGTQDFGSDPVLTVSPGVAPPPIQVVATYGGGSIKGKLRAEATLGPGNVIVLLVPQFSSLAGPQVTQALPDPANPNQLQFRFQGLAPGSYSAWAFASADIEYRSADFLRTLSGGTAVEVDESGERNLTLNGVAH